MRTYIRNNFKKIADVLLAALIICVLLVTGNAAGVRGGAGELKANLPVTLEAFAGERVAVDTGIAFDDDTTELLSVEVKNLDTGELCSVDDLFFTPVTAGIHKITLVKTRVGTAFSTYYYLEVAYSPEPVAVAEPSFPYAFVNGSEYVLPELKAYLYTAGAAPAAVAVTIKAEYNGSSVTVGGDRLFTPDVARSGDVVTLVYTAGGTEKRYDVPVVFLIDAGGTLRLENAFVRKHIDRAEVDRSYCTYYASTSGARLEYCNIIPVANFRLRWKMLEEYHGNFDEMAVILTDSADAAQSVELRFSESKADKKTYLTVNDGVTYTMNYSFADGSFNIKYGSSKRDIIDDNGSVGVIPDTAAGKPFTGFGSGLIKVAVEFRKVRDYSAIAFSHIGNQTLNSAARDAVSPYIFFPDEVVVRYELGDRIEISRAIAYDILDPSPRTTLSVYKLVGDEVSDEPVLDENGILLENVESGKSLYITATQICSYRIEYTAVDWNNRKETRRFIYYVVDNEPPKVVFGSLPERVNAGAAVTLPDLKITDNNGAAGVTVQISYLTPSGVLEVIPAGRKSVTFEVKGRYMLRYFIYDAYYNYVIRDFYIDVV